MEEIAISFNRCNQEKYDFLINKYDFTNIKTLIRSIFDLNDTKEVGKKLSQLRAEIAHSGADNGLLQKIRPKHGLLKINGYLEIIIASHIYEKIGISSESITEFQQRELRKYN